MNAEYALSETETTMFHNNGFLKLEHTLPSERVEQLEEAIWRNIENEIEPVVRDDAGTIGRLSNIIDRDDVFWETITGGRVLDPLESLLGPNIVVLKNRHNHATLRRRSDTKGVTDFHRDVRQWSRPIVTALFYLTDTTLENGCTRLVPGSHEIPTERIYDEDGDLNEDDEIFTQSVPVPMPRGGILLINSLVMHAVGMNNTDEPRTSITVGYHSSDCLSRNEDPNRILVRGEDIYRGHDY